MSGRMSRALIGGCFALIIVIWAARRPDQFSHPYAWVEESFIFDTWQKGGFFDAAFTPVQGYLVLPSSVSVSAILSLSFLDFPILAYIVALGWFLVLPALWLFPGSRLPLEMRLALAVAPVLVPTGPEVFGVLLYSIWWVTLWPVAVLFWDSPKWALRIPVLLLAGLSGLAGGALFFVFAVQWALRRKVEDAVSAAVLFATLIPQLIIYSGSERSGTLKPSVADVIEQAFANIGKYPLVWFESADQYYLAFIGFVVAGALLYMGWYAWNRNRAYFINFAAFLLVLGVFTVLSAIPAPGIAAPTNWAGNRYFFLPFTAITWLAIALIFSPWRRVAALGGIAVVAGLFSLIPSFRAPLAGDKPDWEGELIAACAEPGKPGQMPFHFDGRTADAWQLALTEDTCVKVREKTGTGTGRVSSDDRNP